LFDYSVLMIRPYRQNKIPRYLIYRTHRITCASLKWTNTAPRAVMLEVAVNWWHHQSNVRDAVVATY